MSGVPHWIRYDFLKIFLFALWGVCHARETTELRNPANQTGLPSSLLTMGVSNPAKVC